MRACENEDFPLLATTKSGKTFSIIRVDSRKKEENFLQKRKLKIVCATIKQGSKRS